VELGKIQGQLEELGFQLIAVSPDSPADLSKTASQYKLGFRLAGDSRFAAMDAYGVAWSKKGGKPLPVPAVFVFGADGLVHFQYVNPNHAIRLSDEVLLSLARAAQGKKEKSQ
jgi:peroxiredoxin